MAFLKFALSSLLLITASSLHAFELVPHSATYSANIKKGVKIKGKAVRELRQIDAQQNKWLYRFNVDSFAADIRESVVFSFATGQLKPEHYTYQLSPFFGRDRKRQVVFDWANKLSTNPLKKGGWKITNTPDNTYDRLSYQLQLLQDFDQKRAPVEYNIAHKAKLRPSRFAYTRTETLDTALGPASAVVVTKVRDEGKKRQTVLWLSTEYPMLLLKMTQIEKDGEMYEISLDSAIVDGKAIQTNDLINSHIDSSQLSKSEDLKGQK